MINNQYLNLVTAQLAHFATQANFESIIATAFGSNIEPTKILKLRKQWLSGDFSIIPQIDILSNGELGQASGGYAAAEDKIFISSAFLAQNQENSKAITGLLLEEIGHKIDRVLNGNIDSPGDEGEIFSRLVTGQNLSPQLLARLKIEDDQTNIIVAGKVVSIEQGITVTGGSGNDTLTGGTGDDTLIGNAGNDKLYAKAGNDTLYGGEGNDQLYGEADNDKLYGGEGNDTLDGGTGNDTLYGEGNGFLSLLITGDDYLYGREGNDTLDGGNGDDYLNGEEGSDTLYGGYGNDSLYGGDGGSGNDNDKLDGGDGNDTYRFISYDTGVCTISETNTGGIDTIYLIGLSNEFNINLGISSQTINSVQLLMPALNIENVSIESNGNATIIGNNLDNSLYGNSGNDTIDGAAGNDYLYGYGGNDTLKGGVGNDYLSAGEGNDTLDGGIDNDYLYGGTGNDTLNGGDGIDRLRGGDGDDKLDGGAGNDKDIFSPFTALDGGAGNDEIKGGTGDDELNGGTGNDYLYGGTDNDGLSGGDDNDYLYGEAGNDGLSGENGNDTLYGGIGNDYLDGGDGNDTLSGGNGNDIYSFTNFGGEVDRDRIDETNTDGIDTLDFKNVSSKLIIDLAENTPQVVTTGLLLSVLGNIENIEGGSADDLLFGNNLNNALNGGGGNDTLYGEAGNDNLSGGVGNDTLDGGEGNDYLIGGSGDDTLEGRVGNNNLDGGEGNDKLSAGEGNDTLIGGKGFDILNGQAGNDNLYGGAGNDTLKGGLGNDRFYFGGGVLTGAVTVAALLGKDTISDFRKIAGNQDKILLSKSMFTKISTSADGLISNFVTVPDDTLAATRTEAIVYSSSTGNLFYNENGNAAGFGTNGGNFATVSEKVFLGVTIHSALIASDFTIIV